MARRRVVIPLITLVLAGSIGLWWPPRPPVDVRRIVLISIDTCRADHLGSYGYKGNTTPHIDRVAREGVLFENVVSPVPMTLPSHSTMLTGTNPPYHGVHTNLDQKLGASNVSIAEMLQEQGFSTGAIVSAFVLDRQFGLDQGFDSYDDEIEQNRKSVHVSERKGDETTQRALRWLRQHKDESFFLFLHFFDPHVEYEPPEPFATRFAQDPYAGEIAFADDCVGRVVRELEALGLYDSTLLIITADHGEMRGEHGESTHSYFIYEAAMRVPLIFRLPGAASPGVRVKDLVGLVDIVPTVCALLNLTPPPQVVGEDLSVGFTTGTLPRHRSTFYYGESFTSRTYNANPVLSIRGNRWKYIQTTRPELYDLNADPAESRNLVQSSRGEASRLRKQLAQLLDEQFREDPDSALELDAKARTRIESIGYVGGGAVDDAPYFLPGDRDDPKDLLGFHTDYQRVLGLQSLERHDLAWELCEQLIERRPDFLRGMMTLSQIAKEQGRLPEAIPYLNRILELEPDDATGRTFLGIALAQQGKFAEAIGCYRLVLQDKPEDAMLHNNLGLALYELGRTREAIGHYERALEIDEEFADAHYNLGKALEAKHRQEPEHGWLDGAINHYRKALLSDPTFADAHINLGSVAANQGRLSEAIEHFRHGLGVEPDHFLAHHNLARALHARGDLDGALIHFREAVALDPKSPAAYYGFGVCLASAGRLEAAIEQFRAALEREGDLVGAHNDLAWLLATRPESEVFDPLAALVHARRAADLTRRRDPGVLDTLAATLAAAGQFDRAIETAQAALTLATAAKAEKLSAQITSRLKLYEKHLPYREKDAGP